MTTVAAYVPDLMDRSKVAAALPGVVFVSRPAELVAAGAEAAVVDLTRPGVEPALGPLVEAGVRVVAFANHTQRELMERARVVGCAAVMPRSEFFSDPVSAVSGGRAGGASRRR